MNQRKIVCALAEVARFRSLSDAARIKGVSEPAIKEAIENGTRSAGLWWIEADWMDGPFKPPKEIPLIRDDGQWFRSRGQLLRTLHPSFSKKQYHDAHRTLTRCIQGNRAYEGRIYHYDAGVKC